MRTIFNKKDMKKQPKGKSNLFNIAIGVAICGIAGGLITTTGIIAHQLIISNEKELKIKKVENLGELEFNSEYNTYTTYLRITFNKNILYPDLDTDTSNEDMGSTSEFVFGSSSDIIYTNANKIEIKMTGGFVSEGDSNFYTLNGPIRTMLDFWSNDGGTYYCEVDWGLEFYSWNESGTFGDDNICGQHVKDIHCTTEKSIIEDR